ncbi:MAG TPA: lasso peptide biosynthesis B2 protein [Longimicrobiaceae bacterium]|nr:lasso peptide biosynthesis B2 protein [Longimicrobiaceae bacterium]
MSARTPSVLRCALALLAVRAHLKARGFGPSVALARSLGARVAGAGLAPEEVERTAYRVAVAAAFFPGRAVCLEQSLALYVLLRRRGAPAELRLGVQVYPFHAHAWVELDGAAVNEDPETVERFRAFPEVVV